MKHMKLVSRRPLPDDLLQVLLGDAAILGGLGQFPLLHDGDEAVLEVLLNVVEADGVLHGLETSLCSVISRVEIVGVVLQGGKDRLEVGGGWVLAPLNNRHLHLHCTDRCTTLQYTTLHCMGAIHCTVHYTARCTTLHGALHYMKHNCIF